VARCAVLATLAIAWPASADTLSDAVRQTLATHPRLGAAKNAREAAAEELRQARGLYLPQVDVSAGYGREATEDIAARRRNGAGLNAGALTLERQEATVGVVQRLFNGFETTNEVERQKARVEAAAGRVAETAEFLALDAIETYLNVARQRDLLRLADQNITVHLEILDSLRRRTAGGGGSTADVMQTEARLARARATQAQTTNDLKDAEAVYQRVIGQPPGVVLRPNGAPAGLPQSVDAAVEVAQAKNPPVVALGAEAKAADRAVGAANAGFLPKVNLEAEGSYFDNRDGVATWEREGQVMLRARWNLYRGGADLGRRRESLARHSESENRRANAQIEASDQARRAWNAMQGSRSRALLLTDAVKFSVDTRDAYRQQFSVGQRSLLDVLDAENELFVTRGQKVTAEHNLLAASYRLLAITGGLLRSLDVAPPPEADPTPRSFLRDLVP
jgi:outer membrane protein, adhesin transport system